MVKSQAKTRDKTIIIACSVFQECMRAYDSITEKDRMTFKYHTAIRRCFYCVREFSRKENVALFESKAKYLRWRMEK